MHKTLLSRCCLFAVNNRLFRGWWSVPGPGWHPSPSCQRTHIYAPPHPLYAGELATKASWPRERCDKVLAEMLREGLAMIDDGAPGGVRLYWFPALSNQQQQQQTAGTS